MRLALLALISFLVAVPAFAAEADLVGLWNFDQGNALDSSGKGNDGRIVGAPQVIDGAVGKALLFNGATDYIDLQRKLLDSASEFTVAFYLKPHAWGYKVSLVGQNDLIELLLGANSVQLWSPRGSIDCVLPAEAALYTWTHIAVTGKSGQMSLYVNGRLQRSVTLSAFSNFGTSSYSTKIGAGVANSEGDYLYGALDEIRIYSRALSLAEIAPLAAYSAAATAVTVTSPVAGKLYLNGIYTGKSTADVFSIPQPGIYLLGVGGDDERFYQKQVTASGSALKVTFTEAEIVAARKWRVLFLAVRNMNIENGLKARLTDQDIVQGIAAFDDAGKRWVNKLSFGLAEWKLESRTVEDVTGNLVWLADTKQWQDNIDTARFVTDAKLTSLSNEYDTVFFFWPRVPDGATTWVCCTAYGGGFGVSVPNSWPRAFGWTDAVKEVWLHEWLHVAENQYRSQGRYTGIDGLHGHEVHGFQKTNDSWLGWYKPYMRGQVVESAQFVGIPPAAWMRSTRITLTPAGVCNAGSYQCGAVSPGEIVSLFGDVIGTERLAQAVPSGGYFPNRAGGVQVLFDNTPATLIYEYAQQTSVIVPYATAQRAQTAITVINNGIASTTVTVPVQAAIPGIFSADSSGTGQGAVLNADNSLNSRSQPATKGQPIVLFMTGEGQTNPAGVDGKLAASVYPKPVLPVTVTIGGRQARVDYYGAAPTLVAGVMQVNAVVPEDAPSGDLAVVVNVGGVRSQANLTVAVR
jgi:uncharacterized protein (TIGR03437 family)